MRQFWLNRRRRLQKSQGQLRKDFLSYSILNLRTSHLTLEILLGISVEKTWLSINFLFTLIGFLGSPHKFIAHLRLGGDFASTFSDALINSLAVTKDLAYTRNFLKYTSYLQPYPFKPEAISISIFPFFIRSSDT